MGRFRHAVVQNTQECVFYVWKNSITSCDFEFYQSKANASPASWIRANGSFSKNSNFGNMLGLKTCLAALNLVSQEQIQTECPFPGAPDGEELLTVFYTVKTKNQSTIISLCDLFNNYNDWQTCFNVRSPFRILFLVHSCWTAALAGNIIMH